jgi:hypothetical protein
MEIEEAERSNRQTLGTPKSRREKEADRFDFQPSVFDRYVLVLGMTGFLQTVAKSAQTVHVRAGRCAMHAQPAATPPLRRAG